MNLLDSIGILSRLGRVLRTKFSSRRVSGEQMVCFEIDSKLLSEVRRLGISKAGNVSYVGKLENRWVKIYQAFNATHARFIQHVCEHPEVREYFPRVLHRKERYIIVEWIDGKPLTAASIAAEPQLLERLVRMQATLHTHHLPEKEVGFDYAQFLEERLHRFRAILPLSNSMERILQKVHGLKPSVVSRLSHPDVTPKNLVFQRSSKRLIIVDNELLTQMPGYLIDLLNTYYGLGHLRQLGMQYVALYRQYAQSVQLWEGWDSYLLALWGLRRVGALFQAGKPARAYQLASQIAAGELDDHPLVRMIQEETGQ
jgi:thiamine kinase-like enzyme